MHVTHNDNIKMMDDVICHLELEEERLKASKLNTNFFMATSSLRKPLGHKHKHKMGPITNEKEWLISIRNQNLTNMGKEIILLRRKIWSRLSALIVRTKGTSPLIVSNLIR